MVQMAKDATGNDVHANRKNSIFKRFSQKNEFSPFLDLQNSGPVPIRFLGTTCRLFLKRSASRDTLAAVFQIRGWFYDGEWFLSTVSSTTATSSAVSPYNS
jgi:hypothetical protein